MNGIPFAYFGPETMLPITSVVAACIGFFLMFGRSLRRPFGRMLRARTAGLRGVKASGRPHFRVDRTDRSHLEETRP